MKRFTLFGLFLLLTGGASALGPYCFTLHFLRNLLSQKSSSSYQIPQFILDTNHPWLRTNAAWLSRYPNIGEQLCSPDSSLWTPPLSTHRPPADLFTNLSINNNVEGGICQSSSGWSNTQDRLQEMASCKAAMLDVRNLHVDVYVHDDKYMMPPPALPELFSDVLAEMSNLERLDWGISSEATREFEPAFVAKGLTLPSVKHLRPGAGSDYLVSRCPNLEVIEAGSYFHHSSWHTTSRAAHLLELIKASTGLKNLKEWHLSMSWDGWTTDLVQAILDATPNITGLHMEGNLNPLDASHGYILAETEGLHPYPFRGRYATLKRYLHLLSQFPNLERLGLPASHELDLGFDGGHWCGNAYDGPEGRAYGRRVTQEGAETAELASTISLDALPYLKSLSVGSEHGNLTVNDGGRPEITWPWTGRMEQYTYEMWEDWE